MIAVTTIATIATIARGSLRLRSLRSYGNQALVLASLDDLLAALFSIKEPDLKIKKQMCHIALRRLFTRILNTCMQTSTSDLDKLFQFLTNTDTLFYRRNYLIERKLTLLSDQGINENESAISTYVTVESVRSLSPRSVSFNAADYSRPIKINFLIWNGRCTCQCRAREQGWRNLVPRVYSAFKQ